MSCRICMACVGSISTGNVEYVGLIVFIIANGTAECVGHVLQQ